jgi:hypothetical protein
LNQSTTSTGDDRDAEDQADGGDLGIVQPDLEGEVGRRVLGVVLAKS